MEIKTTEDIVFTGNVDTSILDSALSQGHVFEYSCKNGQCGVCKTTLLKGKVVELQAQQALTGADKAAKKILTCCSAPQTDILIDTEELNALCGIEVKTLPARIASMTKHSEHIIEVKLRLPPTASFQFLEGQYIDVIGSNAVRRSYSIANAVSQKNITLFIKKVEAGVLSKYWFEEAQENDLLRIEGPKGSFFFREPAKQIVFLATGTGIAPIKSILDKLVQDAEQYKNVSFSLYWGNRSQEDFFWQPEYTALNLKFVPVLSRADALWQGKEGYIQDVFIADDMGYSDMQVYACGSLAMINSAKEVLMKNGLLEKHFYADAFVSS